MTNTFKLDKRLNNDTHLLLDRECCLILLHKNATIPWIILVPKTAIIEVFDLPEHMHASLNKMTKKLSGYFKQQFNVEKMNIAAIGNIVSQLHIHVIGRSVGDACWPDVVWGNKYAQSKYSLSQIKQITVELSTII